MKILFVTQWFDPEPNFKGLLFAKALAARGHEIEILTGFPNYPGGKLYPGYKVKPVSREILDGIHILRVPLYPSHDQSSIRRVANYLSFAASASVPGSLLVKKADVAYVYHPPITIGLSALLLRHLRRIPFVLDVQDLWPDTLSATGMIQNRFAINLIGYWCKMVYRSASRIAVLSPGFKSALIDRGVPEPKLKVIYNWCDSANAVSEGKELPAEEDLILKDRFNVVFAGNMGPAQSLETVIEAASLLVEKAPRVQFVFVGSGISKEALVAKCGERRLPNVKFLPRRPVSEVSAVLARADALLVHLKDDPLFRITVPSKTQAYLAVGKPIIMAVRGDAADLIRQARAGVVCEPQCPRSLAAAVEQIYNSDAATRSQLGLNGRKYYESQLSLETGVSRFEELFKSACRNEKN